MKSIIINNNKFKSIVISVNFLLPLKAEEMSKNALLAMVLKKGCKKYNSEKEIQLKLAELYNSRITASVEKYNSVYGIEFTFEFINKNYINEDVFEKGLEILNEIIENPLIEQGAFNKQIVDREKENLIIKIREQQDQKRNYALNKIEEVTFMDEDYGYCVFGTESDVQKIDEYELYNHYLKMIQTSNVIIVVNGNINGYDNMNENLQKYFGKYNYIVNQKNNITELKKNKVEFIQENQDISQSVLCFGIKFINLNKDEIFNASVVNAILGGTPSSKLFQNIREKESLAYYSKSIYNRKKQAIYIVSGIEPKNSEKAKELILKEIEKLIVGDFSEEELSTAKDYVISTYKEMEDDKEDYAKFVITNNILFNENIETSEIIDNIEQLDREGIQKISNKIDIQKIFLLGGRQNG